METIEVLRISPDKSPETIHIANTLESLQHKVGGYIEAVPFPDDDIVCIVNEEGKIRGLPPNRALRDDQGRVCDIIAGDFLVVGIHDGDFVSLTDSQKSRYTDRFRYPEDFVHVAGEIVAIPKTISSKTEADWEPVYRHSLKYAIEHEETDLWRSSFQENLHCRDAIEKSIATNYKNNSLDPAGAAEVLADFGEERVNRVLAVTIQQHNWDDRYNMVNKVWASAVDTGDEEEYYKRQLSLQHTHPGLTDLFTRQVLSLEHKSRIQKDELTAGFNRAPRQVEDRSERSPTQLDLVLEKLDKGVEDLFQSGKYEQFLNTMSRFHNYSLNNTILISTQKPDATYVAGFKSWEKKFDRHVNKGEKGIKILAPCPHKSVRIQDRTDDNGNIIYDDRGDALKEKVEVIIPAYRIATVFDISQTTGKELPEIAKPLEGSVKDFTAFMDALTEVSPAPIQFAEIAGKANGFYSHIYKSITIQNNLSEAQTIKTAIHEVSHAILHDLDNGTVNKADKRTKEVQAESVAYVVCQHYGIDSSDYSFGYVAGWSSSKERDELIASMQVIRDTAASLIEEIDASLARQKQLDAKSVEPETPSLDVQKTSVTAHRHLSR